MSSKPTPVPEQKYSFLCTKCGSTECQGDIKEKHPHCAKCSYLGFSFPNNYTKEDMEAYGLAEYERAISDTIELMAFHGGTVQLEAHIRQLKEY